jgi:ferrous iron transport protein B
MDAATAGDDEEEAPGFWGAIGESFATIPANLADLAGTLTDPLGLSVGEVGDMTSAAEEQDVSVGTFGSMVTLFGSRVAAFAYLLFILLYFPCSAAIAAVYRETNLKWTLFAGFWTTFVAYFAAVIFYQTATIGQHMASSMVWIVCMLSAFAAIVLVMHLMGKKEPKGMALAAGAKI